MTGEKKARGLRRPSDGLCRYAPPGAVMCRRRFCRDKDGRVCPHYPYRWPPAPAAAEEAVVE